MDDEAVVFGGGDLGGKISLKQAKPNSQVLHPNIFPQ